MNGYVTNQTYWLKTPVIYHFLRFFWLTSLSVDLAWIPDVAAFSWWLEWDWMV